MAQNNNDKQSDSPESVMVDIERALMGAYDSIFAQSFKFAQYNPDILTTQKGYRIYNEMLTMAACRAPFNVKRYAVLQKPWSIVPAVSDPNDSRHDDAKILADAADYALRNITTDGDQVQDFRAVLFELLRAAWEGFHVTEIIWRTIEDGDYAGKWGFKYFASKPAKQIGFDLDEDTLAVRAIKPYVPLTGYGAAVPVEKVLLYTHAPSDGLPYGMGDGRAAYKHWFVLDSLMKFWSIALERFGGPFLVGKYPAGNETALKAVLASLDKIRQGGSAALPENAGYEMHQLAAGSLDGFRQAADWHVGQIAQNILNNTLTTGEGRRTGSMALGEVHKDTQDIGLGYLRTDIEVIVTLQVIRRFVRYNFGAKALTLCPRFSLGSFDEGDNYKTAQMFDLMIKNGSMHKHAKVIRERLGIPPLDPDEEKLLKDEDAQRQEMQQRQADARLQGKGTAPADDDEKDDK